MARSLWPGQDKHTMRKQETKSGLLEEAVRIRKSARCCKNSCVIPQVRNRKVNDEAQKGTSRKVRR
jgi:hypothetical protein